MFETQFYRPWIVKIMNHVGLHKQSLKYKSRCKDIGIRKFEFAAQTIDSFTGQSMT